MKAWKVALVAAAALAGPLSGVAADGAPRETRLTFIDPEVVSQLPSDLQERMVAQRDDSVFFVHESDQVPAGPAVPQRARFREVTPVTESSPAPTPVVSREPVAESRRPTPRSAADDARRRRDYEAWSMRREAFQSGSSHGDAPALATNEPRFAEVAAPQPAAEAPADEDREDDDSDSDYTTPAQAQLDAARRASRAMEARQRAEAAAKAAAEKLRFAESRRPAVRAFPAAENGRGTYDLAGHIIASRAQRAAARRNMRDSDSDDDSAAPVQQDAAGAQLSPAFIEVAEQDGDGDEAEPLAPALHVRSLAEVMEMRRAHFVRGKPAGTPDEPSFEPSPAALVERENDLKLAAQIPESTYTPPHGI